LIPESKQVLSAESVQPEGTDLRIASPAVYFYMW